MLPGRIAHIQAAAMLAGWLLLAHGEANADAAAGKRIASERCVSCHASTDPVHAALPLLEGQPKGAFIAQWRSFRAGERTAPVMLGLVQQLSEQDVRDLADHYALLSPPRTSAPVGNDAGRALVDRLRCASCHGPQMHGTDAGAALLAGQKARYTAWALQQMRGGTRSHGSAGKMDPLLTNLSNDDIESLAAHFASLP